jgi:hypothetical protein
MVGSVLVHFVLTAPRFGAPGFLVNAATHSLQLSLSVLLGLATGALSVGIAIAAFPVFRQYSQAMALWFVALAVVSLSVSAIENINVMSMLPLSEAYAKANGAERELFQALPVVVASARELGALHRSYRCRQHAPRALRRAVSVRTSTACAGCFRRGSRHAAAHRGRDASVRA